jgi:Phosphotransferase enzyme family
MAGPAPLAPLTQDHLTDAVGHDLLRQLGLSLDHVISGDGDSFVTLLCRDEQHAPVVLKYVRPDAPPDAYRRLNNEARLLQQVPTEWPLRLLRHRTSAAGYLVTELDSGRLLRPATMDEEQVVRGVATALALFQESARGQRLEGIRDRELAGRYYVKVLVKHLLHLWPEELSLWQCCRAIAIVVTALPAMLRRSAPAHGDFLPTNLLYHDGDGSVTFTDLEAFMRGAHPLFDVLAICTIDDREVVDWTWQAAFLRAYLGHVTGEARLNPQSAEFQRAYRGLLTFFLIYRLNEARVNAAAGRYFDGLSQPAFVWRRLTTMLRGVRHTPAAARRGDGLDARRANVRRLLGRSAVRDHLRAMRAFDLHSS